MYMVLQCYEKNDLKDNDLKKYISFVNHNSLLGLNLFPHGV